MQSRHRRFFGGALSAAFFNDAEAKPFHTISVT